LHQNDKIILCLGTNVGDRGRNLKTAVSLLKRHGIRIAGNSSLYETEPVGFEDQPSFYNIALQVSTDLSPEELLSTVKRIETVMGRRESAKFGPRLIDIDILLFNDIIMENETLTIPHARLRERHFALRVLADIDGDALIPGASMTANEAYERVGKEKRVERLSSKELKGVL